MGFKWYLQGLIIILYCLAKVHGLPQAKIKISFSWKGTIFSNLCTMQQAGTINWGIIGCGAVTEVKSGPAFNKVPHSALAAVMRRNAGAAADYALRHGVPAWYTDAAQLIADDGVNAVYIATPPDSHLSYTKMALAAGKPVYVEKPMVLNRAEAEQMANLAAANADRITVAHYRRWWPLFVQVKQLIDEGAIGRVRQAHLVCTRKLPDAAELQKPGVQWRLNPQVSGGGLFHDLAPHQLDLLLYWFGNVLSVKGCAYNHGGAYAADDTVTGSMVFESGVRVHGFWHFAAPASAQEDYCLIEGEAGTLRCSMFWDKPLVLERQGQQESFYHPPPQHNQIYLIEQVVRFLRGEAPNPCPVNEAVKGIVIMDALCNR